MNMSVDKQGIDVQEELPLRSVRPPSFPVLLLVCLSLSACITDISVRRHSSVAISDAEASAILADFSDVINTADSPSDFACAGDFGPSAVPVIYLKDGSVGTYSGPSEINSSADFNAVTSQPGYAKVVSAITWCGGFGPNIIGCAPVPGNSFAVLRVSPSVEGILWAHEFGHTVGLNHREQAGAVMRGTIGASQRNINEAECEDFFEKFNLNYYLGAASGGPVLEKSVAQGSDVTVQLDGMQKVAAQSDDDVVSFVRQLYPHGTPMGVATRYENSDAIPTLLNMLVDSNEEAYWGNIAAVLGMIGGSDVAAPLIRFANEQHQTSPGSAGTGNTSAALMALGYLANRTGEEAAIEFLAAASDPNHWAGDSAQAQQLAIAAHIGMAFTGQPAANPSARAAGDASVLSDSLARELQLLRDEVASVGIVEYYR